MKIWIDTDSGTWGDQDNGEVRILDLAQVAAWTDAPAGEEVDAYSLLSFLEGASDDEIREFGREHGHVAQ